MVLEDDAVLYDGFLEDFQHAMKDATLLPQVPDVWFFNVPTQWYYEYKGKPHPLTVKEQNLGPWVTNTCSPFTGYLISKRGAEKLLETAFPLDMHVDLYTCLAGDLNHIFTVAHRNVIVKDYLLKEVDSDIRADDGNSCMICTVPTNYEKRGIVVVNLPVLCLALAAMAGMYYLGRKRR
jgi:hypothetical protein